MRQNVILLAAKLYIASSLPRYNTRRCQWSKLKLLNVMHALSLRRYWTHLKLEWWLQKIKQAHEPVSGISIFYQKKKMEQISALKYSTSTENIPFIFSFLTRCPSRRPRQLFFCAGPPFWWIGSQCSYQGLICLASQGPGRLTVAFSSRFLSFV